MSTTMMVVLSVLGALALVVVVAVVVGSMLPRNHVARRRARFRPAPPAVWDVITDHANEASWRPGLRSVEAAAEREGHPVWKEVDSHGQAILFETVDSERPRRLVRGIVPTGLAFGGSWTIELQPEGEGTLVSITEEGEVYNPVFRFVSRFVMGHTATIDAYLKALGERLGDDVVPA